MLVSRFNRAGRCAVLVVFSFTFLSGADEAVQVQAVSTNQAVVDPFAASSELQAAASGGFTSSGTAHALPKMHMRGYLKGKDGEPLALLEIIGGSVHIVREGDTVGLQEIGKSSVVQIKSITRLHLVVESGTFGQMVIVR